MDLKMCFEFISPAREVFKVYRDKTLEFSKKIPNVTEVKIKEKKKIDKNKVRLHTVWKGFGNIPAIVRNIVKPEMISWEEIDIWDEEKLTCTWECKPFYYKEFFTCRGTWKFKDKNDKSQAILDGILRVYIPHFPGVPDKIAQKAGEVIEQIIYKYLVPNMNATIKAIKEVLGE
jgi:hypothetical protein